MKDKRSVTYLEVKKTVGSHTFQIQVNREFRSLIDFV